MPVKIRIACRLCPHRTRCFGTHHIHIPPPCRSYTHSTMAPPAYTHNTMKPPAHCPSCIAEQRASAPTPQPVKQSNLHWRHSLTFKWVGPAHAHLMSPAELELTFDPTHTHTASQTQAPCQAQNGKGTQTTQCWNNACAVPWVHQCWDLTENHLGLKLPRSMCRRGSHGRANRDT